MAANVGLAFALALVLEGLMPLIAPQAWRRAVAQISALADGQIRFLGLAMISAGIALVLVLE